MSTEEKIKVLNQIINSGDEVLINRMHAIAMSYSSGANDWWEELSEHQKKEILEAKMQADRGEFVEYGSVKAKVDQLLSR